MGYIIFTLWYHENTKLTKNSILNIVEQLPPKSFHKRTVYEYKDKHVILIMNSLAIEFLYQITHYTLIIKLSPISRLICD
jgi:hypothetical protein